MKILAWLGALWSAVVLLLLGSVAFGSLTVHEAVQLFAFVGTPVTVLFGFALGCTLAQSPSRSNSPSTRSTGTASG